MKSGTVALIVTRKSGSHSLVEILSDDREIAVLETAVESRDEDPLLRVYESRELQRREEDEFGDYIEELLSQPFLRREVQEHGVRWLRSKLKIEQYQKCETDAARIIADYALKLFCEDPEKTEFLIFGPTTTVKIRVFVLAEEQAERQRSSVA